LLLTLLLLAAQFSAAYSACRGIMPAEECQLPEASHCAPMTAEESSKTGPDCAEICRLGSDPTPAVLQKELLPPLPDEGVLLPTAELPFRIQLSGQREHAWTAGDDIHAMSAEVYLLNSALLI
jgi:hypothetical protein